jgi:hypothetical protein
VENQPVNGTGEFYERVVGVDDVGEAGAEHAGLSGVGMADEGFHIAGFLREVAADPAIAYHTSA